MKLVKLGDYLRPCQVRRSNACIIDSSPPPQCVQVNVYQVEISSLIQP